MKRQSLKKKLWSLFLTSCALLLNACSTPVPNVPVCVELDINKAGCVKLISGEQMQIDDKHLLEGKTYWQIRPEMILVPASSWVEIKKFIIDICHSTNMCQQEVASWDRSIDVIDQQLDKKGGN